MKNKILIVDDEKDIRDSLSGILQDEGFEIITAKNDKKCFEQISKEKPDVVILDIWLEGSELNGIEILERVHKDKADLPVVMITGHGDIKTAIKATKLGAYDFLEKPFNFDKLVLIIERAIELKSLRNENKKLSQNDGLSEGGFLLGHSVAVVHLLDQIDNVSRTNSRVFITGETGTGKASIAKLIHEKSSRAEKPFVIINCATMNNKTLDEKLFGIDDKEGLLEKAQGGTLFLNEISDMSLDIQGKIASFLLQETFARIGSDKTIKSDCRIISSTEKNVEKLIKKGAFRQDLFYRLNVVPVNVPSLSERTEDLKTLSEFFIKQSLELNNLPIRVLSEDAILILQRQSWAGNIVQLKNVCDSIVIMNANSKKKEINKDMLPSYIINGDGDDNSHMADGVLTKPLKEARNIFEKEYLEDQLERFGWNISKTAEFVDMERSALHKKLKMLDIKHRKITTRK
jgi:two-component system, NtrC family, nitrogen regulation response regulator NtrX